MNQIGQSSKKLSAFRRGQIFRSPDGFFLVLLEEKAQSTDSAWLAILMRAGKFERGAVMDRYIRGCELVIDLSSDAHEA